MSYNEKLKNFSRELRKNMTDAELLLWSKIRRKEIGDFQFYRQKPVGDYIVDFYCHKAKLIIEIDGGQHYEDMGKKRDEGRDKVLTSLGFKVLRFTNIDVLKNIDGVLMRILKEISDK